MYRFFGYRAVPREILSPKMRIRPPKLQSFLVPEGKAPCVCPIQGPSEELDSVISFEPPRPIFLALLLSTPYRAWLYPITLPLLVVAVLSRFIPFESGLSIGRIHERFGPDLLRHDWGASRP